MSYSSGHSTRTPAMLDAARSGAGGMGFKGPSNIQFMLTRMTAFSKNTIRLQPQTKSIYNPQDTMTFRLPASALLDMASMTLKFDFCAKDKAAADGSDKYGGVVVPPATQKPGTEVIAAPPKTMAGFFRRVDVSMGATSVGLTGLHDYGCLSTLLYNHTIPADNARQDGNWLEQQGDVYFQDYVYDANGVIQRNTMDPSRRSGKSRYALGKKAGAVAQAQHPCILRNYLGLMGGTYFRLLDTNLLPEVTVSFTIAPQQVIQCSDLSRVSWTLENVSLSFESLNFGDGVYRSMVDQRLATGDLVLPFVNFVGFEGNQIGPQQPGTNFGATGATSITQFTVATKSLNGVFATFRRGSYDQTRGQTGGTLDGPTDGTYNTMVKTQGWASQGATPQSDYYQCFCGHDVYGLKLANMTPDSSFDIGPAGAILRYASDIPYDFYKFGQANATINRWIEGAADGSTVSSNGPNYQFTIDSKLYPQFVSNVVDSAMLVKNFFDNGGLNLSTAGTIPSFKDFLGYAWMFAIGLDHHSDDQRKNKIVSGLDTRNSQIPITFTANNLPTAETLRPTIFAAMTSVLVIGPDRIVSTVL